MLSTVADASPPRPLRLRDIPLALAAPRRVFARVEDVAVYGWPLVVLLAAVTLIGYAKVETGLIDRQVEGQVARRIAEIDRTQRDVVERSALRELYEEQRKQGEFDKLLARFGAGVAAPLEVLAAILLIGALLYGMVALTGRKPEWHTLLTVLTFASFADALRLLLGLVLMLRFGTLEIETSLAAAAPLLANYTELPKWSGAMLPGLLSALDPFRIWFWLIVIAGLSATAQLRGWRAWLPCTLCWLFGALVRTGVAAAAASPQ